MEILDGEGWDMAQYSLCELIPWSTRFYKTKNN